MAEFDADMFAENAVNIGLFSHEQLNRVRHEADDGSLDALMRVLTRKGLLTSWQKDKILKGEMTGFVFGGCKVLFHLAEGTFARVYRGMHLQGGQPVAIKVLRRRFTTDRSSVDRFNQEAEAGLKLVHPNIVRIMDYGEVDQLNYMIMEYVEGSNLRDFLKIRMRLSPSEALPMMIGLADGLKYSLDQGVTHRDIKGTNILIGSKGKGEAKLVDFGLATINLDDFTAEATHGIRTVDYSALERSCGSFKGDPRSDIYFLGCVYYQMLTGNAAMSETETSDQLAKMLKRSFHAIRPLSEHRYAPDPELSRIIGRMMTINLDKRYQEMAEVLEDLHQYRASLGETGAESGSATGESKKKKKASKGQTKHGMMTGDDLFQAAFGYTPEEPKVILCVEVQDPIQNVFRKSFAEMGFKVILVGDAERAAERFRETPPDVVVYDADGLGDEALAAFLDMHEKAHEDGRELAAVVILGPRQAEFSEQLPKDDRLVVVKKPLKMKDVQDAVAQLVMVEH